MASRCGVQGNENIDLYEHKLQKATMIIGN